MKKTRRFRCPYCGSMGQNVTEYIKVISTISVIIAAAVSPTSESIFHRRICLYDSSVG